MKSLKGYIPSLAGLLNTTPAALYERQRALVRVGLLDPSEGRGPGSGVKATDANAAVLLISVLATGSLSEADARTKALADAKSVSGKCDYTKQRTFAKALSAALSGTGKADMVTEVAVSRTADRAWIKYREYGDHFGPVKISEFVGKATEEPAISVMATINQGVLHQIAADINQILMEEIDSEKAAQP